MSVGNLGRYIKIRNWQKNAIEWTTGLDLIIGWDHIHNVDPHPHHILRFIGGGARCLTMLHGCLKLVDTTW